MNLRIILYAVAIAFLVATWVLIWRAKREGHPFFETTTFQDYSLPNLLLASFFTLFAELAFIRWIAVEVRVFAYCKNLALLLCFVGFGLGCALAKQKVRWLIAIEGLLGLLVVVRLPYGRFLEGLSLSLGGSADVEIWATSQTWKLGDFLVGAALAGFIFVLLLSVFVPLGQTVSRQFDLSSKPLSAYSWNLLGSLAGILAFLAISRMMLPPWVWLAAVLVGFSLMQPRHRDRKLILSLLVPLVLLLVEPANSDHFSFWTPYQQIEYKRFYLPNGEFVRGLVHVNHTGYQAIVNLSSSFLASHPDLLHEKQEDNPYNLPFRFARQSPTVMIVGSGAGNDVAGAARHDSTVDAVEIDPAILALGKSQHPEHPYDSPRVTATLTDARAFLKRTTKRYDLILFGLLDSHTQFSDYSNMRLDNFVYTEESFEEAKNHLSPEGIVFIKFQVDRPWISRRLADMLQRTFGKPPLVFRAESNYAASATCFVISPSNRVEDAIAKDSDLADFVRRNTIRLQPEPVPLTTDDWPYLYQKGQWIPRTYFGVGIVVIVLTVLLYLQIPEARSKAPSLFFFSMGAGFLLLETQVISRLALYFGTTWQVNGVVISAVLTALLAANLVIDRAPRVLRPAWLLPCLLAGLVAVYFLPTSRLPESPTWAGILMASAFSIPVFFAGLLFASEFRRVESPSSALGANMLGAVAGGLLENVSLMTGMRFLLLITVALYCLAAAGLLVRGRTARPAV